MCTFTVITFLNVLLVLEMIHALPVEPSVPMYLEERMYEKIIEINLNLQRVLDRMDKVDGLKKGENIDTSRLPTLKQQVLLVEELETDGWVMVFRATSSNGQNVFKAWTTGVDTCSAKPTTMARSYSSHYRNSIVSNWANIGAKYVKYAYYKSNQEVSYVIFNASGSNINSWFDKTRVLSSSYNDLTSTSDYNIFSIAGYYSEGNLERRFHINKAYGGCDVDNGHMVISEQIPENKGCYWDKHPNYPQFLYSQINSVDFWNRRMFGRADYMAIFIKS